MCPVKHKPLQVHFFLYTVLQQFNIMYIVHSSIILVSLSITLFEKNIY